mmetsp:Transcript_57672/g.172076  ORF Transcript_57672/g.172076 Transcript_57672/m.172076 type:complete len:349 (-) Transcript_57672:71-1117(-)
MQSPLEGDKVHQVVGPSRYPHHQPVHLLRQYHLTAQAARLPRPVRQVKHVLLVLARLPDPLVPFGIDHHVARAARHDAAARAFDVLPQRRRARRRPELGHVRDGRPLERLHLEGPGHHDLPILVALLLERLRCAPPLLLRLSRIPSVGRDHPELHGRLPVPRGQLLPHGPREGLETLVLPDLPPSGHGADRRQERFAAHSRFAEGRDDAVGEVGFVPDREEERPGLVLGRFVAGRRGSGEGPPCGRGHPADRRRREGRRPMRRRRRRRRRPRAGPSADGRSIVSEEGGSAEADRRPGRRRGAAAHSEEGRRRRLATAADQVSHDGCSGGSHLRGPSMVSQFCGPVDLR